jgi:hypothetical protein
MGAGMLAQPGVTIGMWKRCGALQVLVHRMWMPGGPRTGTRNGAPMAKDALF